MYTHKQVHTYTASLPIYSSYPIVRHRTIPFIAHKRLVTGTRLSVTPTRSITRVVSLPTFRASTPIRFSTPIRYPITPIAVLSPPSRLVHSYTTRLSTSPIRTNYSIRVRPSVLNSEYKRIQNKVRAHPELSYTNNYLNSEYSRVSFYMCLYVCHSSF